MRSHTLPVRETHKTTSHLATGRGPGVLSAWRGCILSSSVCASRSASITPTCRGFADVLRCHMRICVTLSTVLYKPKPAIAVGITLPASLGRSGALGLQRYIFTNIRQIKDCNSQGMQAPGCALLCTAVYAPIHRSIHTDLLVSLSLANKHWVYALRSRCKICRVYVCLLGHNACHKFASPSRGLL